MLAPAASGFHSRTSSDASKGASASNRFQRAGRLDSETRSSPTIGESSDPLDAKTDSSPFALPQIEIPVMLANRGRETFTRSGSVPTEENARSKSRSKRLQGSAPSVAARAPPNSKRLGTISEETRGGSLLSDFGGALSVPVVVTLS